MSQNNNFRKLACYTNLNGEICIVGTLAPRSLLIVHNGKDYVHNVVCDGSCRKVTAQAIARYLLRAMCETEKVTLLSNQDSDMQMAARRNPNAFRGALRGHRVYVVDNKGRILMDEGCLDITANRKCDGTKHTLASALNLKASDELYRLMVGRFEGSGSARTFVPANGKWDDEKVDVVLKATVASVFKQLEFVNKFQLAVGRAAKANTAEERALAKKEGENTQTDTDVTSESATENQWALTTSTEITAPAEA